MQIPKFSSQERVDLPDLTAVSYLVLGEFRRTARGILLGPNLASPPDHLNYVIRGFAVEAASPPDTTVLVRLDPGGANPLSFAFGAENLGARIDFGQLIGGDGMDGTLEGNATYTLDFGAQPPGTYTVEMRHVYADGANDNRAFWDEGGNAEFIAATDTRALPAIELRLSGAPSSEWITLASVVWGGATIVAGNITDARVFAFEGATPFRQTSQTGSGGMADFDRSTSRGGSAGLNEVYPVLRALGRQIQDLKGASDDARWDWFSRVYSPFDPANALGAATKSLRSVDTVTYTVGDGTATFGDFNGTTGLDACLTHIAGIAGASRAARIEIVVHGGATYTLSGPTTLTANTAGRDLTVIIRAGQKLDATVDSLRARPSIIVDGAALGVNERALLVQGSGGSQGSLTLEGLQVTWTGTTAGGRGMFACTGPLRVHDCYLDMGAADVAAGRVLISTDASRTKITNSYIRGRTQFYNDEGTGSLPAEHDGGLIEHCELVSAQIMLHADSAGAPGIDAVNGFTIRACKITGRTSAIYTSSIALIDAACARNLRVLDCSISFGGNEDAISGYTRTATAPFDWRIEGNRFDDAATNGAVHAVGAGSGGAAGTGWAINVATGSQIKLRGNRYAISLSVDAGAVRLSEVSRYTIDDDEHFGCGHTAGGTNRYEGYLLTGTADGCTIGSMRGVSFADWSAGVTRVRCINANLGRLLTIDACSLVGREAAFGTALAPDAGYGALRVAAFGRIAVAAHFDGWAAGTANSRTVLLDGSCDGVKLRSCTFDACGGFSLVRTSGTPTTIDIDDCAVTNTTSGADGFDLTSTIEHRVTNCTFVLSGGGTRQAIVLGANNFLVMGNRAANASIHNPGTAYTGRGFNEAGQDLNLVSAYTT